MKIIIFLTLLIIGYLGTSYLFFALGWKLLISSVVVSAALTFPIPLSTMTTGQPDRCPWWKVLLWSSEIE